MEQATNASRQPSTVPTGNSLLGRVINYAGEPLDNLGPLEGTHSIVINSSATVQDYQPGEFKVLETGLKAVDLFAPLSFGSITGLFSQPGLGKQVVVGEIVHNLARHQQAIMVFAGLEERLTGPHDTLNPWKELGISQHTFAVIGKAQNDARMAHRVVLTALNLAEFFRDQESGRVVILYIDKQLAEKGQLATYWQRLRYQQKYKNGSIITFIGEPSNPEPSPEMAGLKLDSRLVFDKALADQTIFPAIDSQLSGSQLLEKGAVTAEHLEVIKQVQEYLVAYAVFNEESKSSLEARQTVIQQRGRKLQLFLSQPFFVAESFTGTPGSYIPLEETLAGCRAILTGEVDDLAPEFFLFSGTIEDIKRKASQQNK